MNLKKEIVLAFAEDDHGHATLVRRNLKRMGFVNIFLHFVDGQEILDFFSPSGGCHEYGDKRFLVLLDIRMPKVDGITVLERLKQDPLLKRMPVIMLTTTDDPEEMKRCYDLGCSHYVTKPIDPEKFKDAIVKLGYFLSITTIPSLEYPSEMTEEVKLFADF